MHTYERIARKLREQIDQGVWRPGVALPQISELMETHDTSRITVRNALDQLRNWGLIYTDYVDGRKATIVRSQERIDRYATDAFRAIHSQDPIPSSMDAFTSNAAKVGKKAGKSFSMRIEPAPHFVAERLGTPDDELVVVRQLTQLIDGEPWAVETGYYPRDLAAEVGLDTPHDIERGTIRALADAGYVETGHRDELTFEHATTSIAGELSVPEGAPVAVRIRTAGTEDRITRVMSCHEMAERNRWIWEIGEGAAIGGDRR